MAKVLVVDDSSFTRYHYVRCLEAHGWETVQAGDGDEAVEMYRVEQPDVVLMDITMPRMSGLQAIEEIRALDPQARIIVTTAMGHRSIAVRAIQKGAKEFLVKPVLDRKLLEAIDKVRT